MNTQTFCLSDRSNPNGTRLLSALLMSFMCASPSFAAHWSIVVAGLGGTEPYIERFPEQANALQESLQRVIDQKEQVILLSEGGANLSQLESQFNKLKNHLKPEDSFSLFLIGHGAWDNEEWKFHLSGPDLSGSQLIELLDSLPTQKQLVVVASSASGALLEQISTENRTLITATKSGAERNAPRFAIHFIEGLTAEEADIDKDKLINVQEAYDYALHQIENWYQKEGLLAAEHARMQGAPMPLYLGRIGDPTPATNTHPELAALLNDRSNLETRIATLRSEKSQLDEETYFNRLEPLMIEMATLQARIESLSLPEAEIGEE